MKSKKKEKHKKHKKEKHKKSKKHKHHHHSDSSSQSDDEWEEAGASTTIKTSSSQETDGPIVSSPLAATKGSNYPPQPPDELKSESVIRNEWMTSSSSFYDVACNSTNSRENKTKQRKVDEKKKEEERTEEIYKSRELNPSYRRNERNSSSREGENATSQNKLESRKSYGVADRGHSWIHKAYERAKQRAQEENVPLEDIVNKQWGSMEKLEALLNSASRTSSSTQSSVKSSGWRKASSNTSSNLVTSDKSSNVNKTKDNSNLSNYVSDRKQKQNSNEGDETIMKEYSSGHSVSNMIASKATLPENEKNELNAKLVRAELMGDEELVKKLKTKLEGGSDKAEPISNKVVTKVTLTEKERNELGAKLVRAELMGDDDLVCKLKRKLGGDQGEGEKSPFREENNDSSGKEQVLLTRSDKHGNLYPVNFGGYDDDSNDDDEENDDDDGRRNAKRKKNDVTDLKTMVEQEQLTSVDDHQIMTARLAAKHNSRVPGDDYYTIDDMFVKASSTKGDKKSDDKHIRDKAIAEDRQRKKQLSNCRFCLDNPNIAKHLVITIGTNVYLSLPINTSLTEGHCLIVPINHAPAQTYLDEDVTQEINKFKKSLTRMFANTEEDVMFLETCKNVQHGKIHCVIECIPVPKEIGDMGPIYFKKAISETGSEWSGNKKLVTITSKQGVTRALPKGLPYFAVEFGFDGGFGHIIEEESFPNYFGKEIIGGMMDLEPRLWMKPPKESFEQHKRKVFKFTEAWKEYDCSS